MITFGRLRGSRFTRLGCATVVAASALALSSAPASAVAVKRPLVITATNYKFSGFPKTLTAGKYAGHLINTSDEPHVVVAVNLGPSCGASITTISQAKDFVNSVEDEEAFALACPGGSIAGTPFARPMAASRSTLRFEPGKALYFCPIPEEDGTPHSDLGMLGFINVTSAPATR